MTKAEFLEMMEQKLTGELDENTVAKTFVITANTLIRKHEKEDQGRKSWRNWEVRF